MIKHLALIMDGNRRWAKQRSLKPWLGHEAGAEAIKEVINFCLERAIPHVSLYAFSLENFKRSPEEITYLWDLFLKGAQDELPYLKERNISVRFIGDHALFPDRLRSSIDFLENATKQGTALYMHFLFCYGAQQEIAIAARKIAEHVSQGRLALEDISPAVVAQSLWTAGVPDPELIIRTGSRKRLSNFLLYQAAYSELYFLDCLWPDIRMHHLNDALNYFAQEQRNFGT